ncbi:MAG: hypothetical protein JNM56_38310 [Planctomycetia bacterium]|nr:hypothetical protein [Planctomycetia bacterium]
MAEWETITKEEFYRRLPPGMESSWTELAQIPIVSGKLCFSDIWACADDYMRRTFDVPPGTYSVAIKTIAFANGEKRVSQLRALQGSAGERGQKVEHLGVDSWYVTCFDQEVADQVFRIMTDEQRDAADQASKNIKFAGVTNIGPDPGMILPVAFSGFGAGYFPIFELTDRGQRVGVEVVFIGPEELERCPEQLIIEPVKD